MNMTKFRCLTVLFALAAIISSCSQQPEADYDVIIRGGTVYDGLGGEPFKADVAINGDRIAAIGDLSDKLGKLHIDARDKAVAPGFINMLSWATESLIEDGRAMSDIKQGVTLEIMGEGWSMGPLNDAMKADVVKRQSDIKYDVRWTTLGEYLDYLVASGISTNIASYVGAATVRIHEIGYENRKATAEELANMRALVRTAMLEGAIGVGSSLIYVPASFADTNELIALVGVAAEYDGAYISHIRSEGNRLEEAVQELIKIASITGAPAEIYHLKAAGKQNWHKLQKVFDLIESAQDAGLSITADMYTYPAAATGLDASMPPWVQEGGHDAWVSALKNPDVRKRVISEMNSPTDEWENLFYQTGADKMILLGFKNPKLKPLAGKTLAEVAESRGISAADAAIDLVLEDDSRVGTAYVLMSEDNVRRKIGKDWVSFGSDAAAPATSGVFLESNTHPRAYGTFARVLGKYSRDEYRLSLAEAVRRMTSLPAFNTNIRDRGQLTEDYSADVVVFDPLSIADHSTFDDPHQYSTGVEQVFVNGIQVLKDGNHTGAMPGQVVRGPGWSGWLESQNDDE
jgi:N-acyl-D-amino-acid deacylase